MFQHWKTHCLLFHPNHHQLLISFTCSYSVPLCLVLFPVLNTFVHYLTFCFYHSLNSFKLQIRQPTVFPNGSCLVTQSLLSDVKDSMFFLFLHHSFPESSNRFTIIIKRLTSKETFHNNLIHVLRTLCYDSSRMTTGSPLSNLALLTPLFSEFWFEISLI